MSTKITKMKVSDIRPMEYNPSEARETEKAVNELVEYMRDRSEKGQLPLSPLERLAVGNDGILGDGHRRLAALKILGVEEVEVEVDDERNSWTIWYERNSAMPMTLKQVSETIKRGQSISNLPKKFKKAAEILISLTGQKGLDLAVERGHSVGIYANVRVGLNLMGRNTGDQDEGYKFMKWLIDHNANNILRAAIRQGGLTGAKLRRRVDHNKPLID